MNLETKVKNQLDYLYTMLEKYQELNSKTKRTYAYRQQAIELQIEILEEVLNDSSSAIDTSWDICYKEDLEESK